MKITKGIQRLFVGVFVFCMLSVQIAFTVPQFDANFAEKLVNAE